MPRKPRPSPDRHPTEPRTAGRPRKRRRRAPAPEAPTALGPHVEHGERLGAYETCYEVSRGYGGDRVIVRP